MSYAALLALATLGSGHGCYGGEVVYVSSCYGGCYSSCYSSCYGGCYGSSRKSMRPARRAHRRVRRFARRLFCCYDPCAVVSNCYGSCYGACYGSCYGTSRSNSHATSSQSYYRGPGRVTNGDLAPVPQEEPAAPEENAPLPEVNDGEPTPAEAAPAEATPQARRRAPATRTVRYRVVPRRTLVAQSPVRRVRRSAQAIQPVKPVGQTVSRPKAPAPKLQVTPVKIAKAVHPAKEFPFPQAETRKGSDPAKSVAEPQLSLTQERVEPPRVNGVAAARASARRSLHGVAYARNLASNLTAETRRGALSPAVAKTTRVQAVLPAVKRSSRKSVEPVKALAAQPAAESRAAWYEVSTQEVSDSDSPIRQVSFETLPETQAEAASPDGKKLSVRIAKRRQLRGASERRSRVAHYVSRLP